MRIFKHLDKPVTIYGISPLKLVTLVVVTMFSILLHKFLYAAFCIAGYYMLTTYIKTKYKLRDIRSIISILIDQKYHPRGLKKMFIR